MTKKNISARVDLTENRAFGSGRGTMGLTQMFTQHITARVRTDILNVEDLFSTGSRVINTEGYDTEVILTGNSEERAAKRDRQKHERWSEGFECDRCGRVIDKVKKLLHGDIDPCLCHDCEKDMTKGIEEARTKNIIDRFR